MSSDLAPSNSPTDDSAWADSDWDEDEYEDDESEDVLGERRPLEEAEMDITPMIDITFLLLIFFIVAAKIEPAAGVSLPNADYGVAVAPQNCVIITIKADREGKGEVYLGDGVDPSTKAPTDLVDQRAAIVDYIEQEQTKFTFKQTVLIKGEATLKHREVGRVLSAIGGGTDIKVVNLAVLEDS